jgi:ABC-type transporter Mla subunit MlaD
MPDNADPRRPTIDERLEAVVQSLELVAAMQQDNDQEFRARFAEIAKRSAETEKRFAETGKRFAEVATTLQQIATNQERDGEHILALVRIVEIHEHRLTKLEDRQQ